MSLFSEWGWIFTPLKDGDKVYLVRETKKNQLKKEYSNTRLIYDKINLLVLYLIILAMSISGTLMFLNDFSSQLEWSSNLFWSLFSALVSYLLGATRIRR